MSIKEILALAITLEADENALRAAADLAAHFKAHPSVLIVSVWLGSVFADEQRPLSEVLADLASDESSTEKERAKIQNWLERHAPGCEVRDIPVEVAAARDAAVAHARVSDVIVMCRSQSHARARHELIEDVLFKSGRPLLLLPPLSPRQLNWDRILIAWNARAEAVRAVAGALPLLRAAKQVRIVTVDALPGLSGHGEAPGRELAAYLARHDVKVEVSNIDGLGRAHSEVIWQAALDFGADLIVMGAYGHSRANEFLLGGVSRDLIRDAQSPLWLAH